MESSSNRSQFVSIPAAIIIAGALIAIAVLWATKPAPAIVKTNPLQDITDVNMVPVTASEHILGNPNADVKIVEYSDPSCPYCKLFNPTMEQIMTNYGPSGKVAWIYRSYPLDKADPNDPNGKILHPNAGREAQALECAAQIGGNDKFWAFEKEWYNIFPLQDATDRSATDDTAQLASIAKDIGLDATTFNDCLSSGQMKSKVDAEYKDGELAGVPGTPYNIIITPSGTKIPLTGANGGAVSYATLKSIIDTLVTETK